MEQEIVFFDFALAKIDNFQVQTVEPNAFVPVFAVDHGLAVLQLNGGVVAGRFVLSVTKGPVVEHVAVLIDFDERGPLVSGCAFERVRQVFHIAIDRPSDETSLGTDGNADRVEWMVNYPHRRTLGDLSLNAGRRILTFGQTVDAVVEQNDVQVHVASQQVNEVIAADA